MCVEFLHHCAKEHFYPLEKMIFPQCASAQWAVGWILINNGMKLKIYRVMVFLWRVIAESHFDSFHLEKDIYYPDICIALHREYAEESTTEALFYTCRQLHFLVLIYIIFRLPELDTLGKTFLEYTINTIQFNVRT